MHYSQQVRQPFTGWIEPRQRGPKPLLTPEQDAEIYDAVETRKRLSDKALMARYGVTRETLYAARHREAKRRGVSLSRTRKMP